MTHSSTTNGFRWLLTSRDGAYLGAGRADSQHEALQAGIEKLRSLKRKLGTVKVFDGKPSAFSVHGLLLSTTKISL